MKHVRWQIARLVVLLIPCVTLANLGFGGYAEEASTNLLEKSLAIDYWDESRFAKFIDESPLSVDEEQELHRLVARLSSFDRRVFYASEAKPVATAELIAEPGKYRGKLVRWQGNIQSDTPPAEGAGNVHHCQATSESGDIAIYATEVPEHWNPDSSENRRIAVEGVLVKIDMRDEKPVPILAAAKIEWYPDKWNPPQVNYGMSVMGVIGVDVSLMDNVAHRLPLTSHETAAFYRLLAGLEATSAHDLVTWAERQMPRHRKMWSSKTTEGDKDHRMVALQVEKLAKQDKYSVAPFFNTPREQTGELVTFDGVVRRALRVDVSNDLDATACGLDHYYELALITDDSKNNPVMFCVLELPKGFTAGDDIREPVRMAGFFFKNWRYTSRAADGQLRLAPLFIGHGPLKLVQPPPEPIWGWIAGLGFIALVLALWLTVWLRSRADGRFENETLARIRESAEPLDASDAELLEDLSNR